MLHESLARLLTPWTLSAKRAPHRLDQLRSRDGDTCRRCRRPMRFDLPSGHDQAPRIEQLQPGPAAAPIALDELFLCHVRCHAGMTDHTAQVAERVRRKAEAELFAKPKRRRKRA